MSDEEPLDQNPIVAAAMRIRARRDLGAAIDSVSSGAAGRFEDAETALRAYAADMQSAIKALNSILGRDGVRFVRLEKPLRIRLRFRAMRVSLDLDEVHQLVRIAGLDLDGDYQFDPSKPEATLINLSHISTEAGYGTPLRCTEIVKRLVKDAELPRPAHLDGPGPLTF